MCFSTNVDSNNRAIGRSENLGGTGASKIGLVSESFCTLPKNVAKPVLSNFSLGGLELRIRTWLIIWEIVVINEKNHKIKPPDLSNFF